MAETAEIVLLILAEVFGVIGLALGIVLSCRKYRKPYPAITEWSMMTILIIYLLFAASSVILAIVELALYSNTGFGRGVIGFPLVGMTINLIINISLIIACFRQPRSDVKPDEKADVKPNEDKP